MARPKPAVPVDVPFYARTTRGERDAIDALLAKRTAKVREVEPNARPLDLVGWFRGLVQRECEAEGIAITEPEAPEPVALPARTKPAPRRATKPAAKRTPKPKPKAKR
jgi:hypothetical protein